jgi:hypothetical protein
MRSRQNLLYSLTSAGLLFLLFNFAVLARVAPTAETNGAPTGTVQLAAQTKQKTNQRKQQTELPTANRRLKVTWPSWIASSENFPKHAKSDVNRNFNIGDCWRSGGPNSECAYDGYLMVNA